MFRQFFSATAKKGYVALVDQSIVSGTNFATGVLLARLCTKEQYGLYVLAFSLLILWDGFRNALIALPLVIYLPRKEEQDQPSYVGSTTVMHALIFLAGALIFGAGASIAKATGDTSLAIVVLTAIFALLGYSSREHVRRIFYAHLRVRATLLVDSAYCVLQLGALATLWQLDTLSAANALLALGAAQTGAALLGLFLLSGNISFHRLQLHTIFSSHWKLGKWLVGTALATVLSFQVFPWFLKYQHNTQATAVFGACAVVIAASNPFVMGFGNILAARMAHVFAKEGKKGLMRTVRKAHMVTIGVLGAFAVLVSLFAEPLLWLLYKGRYSGYSHLIALFSVSVVAVSVIMPLARAIMIVERSDLNFGATVVGAVSALTLGFYLVHVWGVTGAVLGVAISRVLVAGAYVVFYSIVFSREKEELAGA
jgi:O-antigen/teichoic acid export membrane protein